MKTFSPIYLSRILRIAICQIGMIVATLLQPLVIAQQVDSSLPKIISHPKDVETEISNDAVFSVVATNALSYQWVKDGRDLLWETNSAIRIDLARFYQAGYYKCKISNESGSIESESAKLTLRGGRVVAWGGNNTHGSTTVPAGLEDVVAVSAGYYHSLALKSDGTVVAWGANWDGRSEVSKGLSNIVSIFTPSAFSIAIDKNGDVHQWGQNPFKNLELKDSSSISNVLSIAVGDSLMVMSRESVLSVYKYNNYSTPTPDGLVDIIDIAGDSGLSLAVKRDGTVMAWGYQDWNRTSVPPDLKSVKRVSTRGRHSLALRSDGTVAAWGMSDFGAISVPNNLIRVISVAAGSWHSLALRDDNTVVAWGDNRDGQCDIPKGLKGVIAISAGEGHNLAIVSDSLFPPVIKQNITSLTVDSGQSAEFKIEARNVNSYQWFKDGNALPGATNAILSLTNARPTLIGDYFAVVSNTYGTATSSVASLNINGVDAGIWKGLVAYYPFNGNANDESGNRDNGLITGRVAPVHDRYQRPEFAYYFDGEPNSKITTTGSNIPINNSDRTISVWVKPSIDLKYNNDGYYRGEVLSFGRVTGMQGYNSVFLVADGNPDKSIVFGADTDQWNSRQLILNNQWNCIQWVYGGSVAKLFVNGVGKKLNRSPDLTLATTGGNLIVGGSSFTTISAFQGAIDDIRIYSRALTESEVKALYESERVPDTIIVNQPQSLSLSAGTKANFSVTATNPSPLVSLTYQWQKDGNPIPGATNSLLTITNVQPVNIGDYNVIINGGFQAVTSSSASLHIEGVNSGIWKGLVAWYELDGNAVDSSVNGDNGSENNLKYSSDRFGVIDHSLSANRIDKNNLIASGKLLPYGDSVRTISVWVKPDIKPPGIFERGDIFGYGKITGDAGCLYSAFLWQPDLRGVHTWSLGSDGFGWARDYIAWDYSKWHHVVYIYDGSNNAIIFIDGLHVGFQSKPISGARLNTELGPLSIGGFTGGNNFDGSIDSFRIYNRSLSDAEVKFLYNSERVPDTVIVAQPLSIFVPLGGAAQLSVTATNPIPTVPIAYQWFKDGAKLVGATNSALNLGQLRPEQIGTYTVTVDDGSRTLTSTAANVSIQGVDSSIWKGLVASYAFEGDFSDSSGFGDSLVPYGVVNFVDQGRRPETKVARVTGLDGFLVGPERAWFSGVQPRTVSVWIKPEATSTNVSTVLTLGGFENCAQRFSLQVPVAQNGIRFDGGDCTNGLRSKTFTGASISGKWTHAVLTYDGSSVRCYVNGLVSGTAYTVALNTDPIAPLVIGNTVGLDSEGFTGLVDDVRIYNRSLSATEVRALFNYESTGVAPSLPQITRQPTPVSGYEGETLKLSVGATGYQLGYQWQRGGQNLASDVRLSGINSSELQIKAARLDDGGDYRVLVTNSFGAVTSSTVKLTVAPPVRSLVAGLANEVQEGQRMTFPLSMVSTGDVGGLTFKLSYNPAFLTDPKVEWSAVVGQSVNTVNTSVAGEISGSFSLAGTALVSGTAALGTVDFRARSVPAQTNVVLSPAIVSVANPSGTLLATGNGAIAGEGRIRPRKIKGDNNANQRIDIGDAVVVSKLLVGLEETRSWDVGLNDLNASQTLDNGDVIKALRTVVGLDPQPSPGSETKRRAGSISLADALGLAKVLVNTNDAMAIELLDGPKATVGQPYRVAVRLNRVKGSLSGLSFVLKYPASLTLTDKQVGALVPGDALPFWNESSGQVSLAAIRSTAWANATGVAAVLTFVPSAGFSAQAEWPLKLELVEITGSGFDVRPVDPVAVAIQSGGGTVNTPPQIALQPPAADGSLTLEIRAPQGATVALEATGDLNTWIEAQRITGQGDSTPVKVTLKPDPTVQAKFWRLRVR